MRRCPVLLLVACVCCLRSVPAGEEVLILDEPEMAGLSGFLPDWDRAIPVAAGGATTEHGPTQFGGGTVADWSGPEPGAPVFDAVHRSLLVRFPGAAAAIAERLAQGWTVRKVELELPFRGTETFGPGYRLPAGMSFLGKRWIEIKPQWHAVAWVLRRPWQADPQRGPTYNAFIDGHGYWARFGAADEELDRFPRRFGPTEVSYREANAYRDAEPEAEPTPGGGAGLLEAKSGAGDEMAVLDKLDPEAAAASRREPARMDVTAVLLDEAFGAGLGRRLRVLEEQGFLLRKEEVYDVRFWNPGYEWATATGGRGILIETPRLIVTFARGEAAAVELPPARTVPALAEELAAAGTGGAPTAVVPDAEAFAALRERFGLRRPEGMPAWQWRRLQELHDLGGAEDFPADREAYRRWLNGMLAMAPRRWGGWDISENVQTVSKYWEAFPAPVQEHWRLYYWSWLMPWRSIDELVHAVTAAEKARAYYRRTGDWRGNATLYRTYCYEMGTMNFNTMFSMGTLIGGDLIGSERCVRDGRHGLLRWPFRTWSWYDGTSQESIDHYYMAMSLAAQKNFADFGPERVDRLLGRMMLLKAVDELAAKYHPGLRRMVSDSGRTGIAYLVAVQDGLQHILHTLSPAGALTDVDRPELPGGIPAVGKELDPGDVALQTLSGPWAPAWFSEIVDGKPLPWWLTTRYRRWGNANLWRTTYLGPSYGLAALDVAAGNETVPFMVQWRRAAEPVQSMTGLGTLIGRFGLNRTALLDSLYHGTGKSNPNGVVGNQGGVTASLHAGNCLVVLTSPFNAFQYERKKPVEVYSLQSTLGLLHFQEETPWSVWAGGKRIEALPARLGFEDRIVLRDGTTYLGILPVPAAVLRTDTEVLLSEDPEPVALQGGGEARVRLRIDAFNFRAPRRFDPEAEELQEGPSAPLMGEEGGELDLGLEETSEAEARWGRSFAPEKAPWKQFGKLYGGFVIEVGDASEWPSFQAFREHIRGAPLQADWNEEAARLEVSYRSRTHRIEVGFDPAKDRAPFVYRRVDGEEPYLAPGVYRESPVSLQATNAVLEKGGARLQTERGVTGYLQRLDGRGITAAYKPFPAPAFVRLATPEGVMVEADGRLGVTRMVYDAAAPSLTVEHSFRPGSDSQDLATALVAWGLPAGAEVRLNGTRLEAAGPALETERGSGRILPLAEAVDPEALQGRLPEARAAQQRLAELHPADHLIDLWQLAGPFPHPPGGLDLETPHPPEEAPGEFEPAYRTADGRTVKWRRLEVPAGGVVDLRKALKGKNDLCAYARVILRSTAERRAVLLTGSDDSIKVWLNGEVVHAHAVHRGAAPDQDRAPVTLRAGENRLLIKIVQGGGGWGFCARVADRFGVPLEGVTVAE